MQCGHQNPIIVKDRRNRPVVCQRPTGHTRWHKGRGMLWDQFELGTWWTRFSRAKSKGFKP